MEPPFEAKEEVNVQNVAGKQRPFRGQQLNSNVSTNVNPKNPNNTKVRILMIIQMNKNANMNKHHRRRLVSSTL